MEFRPENEELFTTCSSQLLCTDCRLRVGCPIRYSFYRGEIATEIALQEAELMVQKPFGEDRAFDAAAKFRHKILCERGAHPGGYSYT
ncbi:MAG: hypothetical protein IJ890_08970 [Clostridia bacterium]|nr:hypothetical protein [Clostridia bacterium]